MSLSAVRSIVTCEKCGNFFESPIKLPCFNTLCQVHVSELMSSKAKNIIDCFFCQEEHVIPERGFEPYTKLDEIIQSKSHLYEEEKELISYFDYSTSKINKLDQEFTKMQPFTEEFILKNLAKLKEQIDLDAQKFKNKIDSTAQNLVGKIEMFENKCTLSLNCVTRIESDEFLKEINEKFNQLKRSSKFDLEAINGLKEDIESVLKKSEKNLSKLETIKNSVKNLSYVSLNVKTEENFLGKIEEKNRTFKLITGSYDNTIRIWENDTCIQTLSQNNLSRSIEVYNSSILISGSKDGEIKFWDMNDWTCIKTLNELGLGHVFCLVVTSDGHLLAGFGDGTIKIWNLDTWLCIRMLKGHSSHVWCIILLPNNHFSSCSSDSKIKIWSMNSDRCLITIKNDDSVNCLVIDKNNNLISGDDNGLIKMWDVKEGVCIETLKGHNSYVFTLEITNKSELISSDGNGLIKIWSLRDLVCIRTINQHTDFICHLKLIDDQRFVSFSADGTIKLWSLENLECVKTFVGINNQGFRCGRVLFNF
jgi:WD40 repeat protein